MKFIIAGGSGAIGRVLVLLLSSRGHDVTALTRSASSADALRSAGVKAVLGDV